ncbi:MAG: SHOCT domain-containing protein [Pseudomonadota bacterium]
MKKILLILTLAMIVGVALYPVMGSAQMGPGMMGGGYGYGMGPGMMGWGTMGWFGPIVMVIFWVAIIVAIVLLIRWLLVSSRAPSHGQKSENSALDILKRRYARGEINKEEFEERKRDLT